MTCKFCGNEIEEGADFCYICGQPVEKVEEAPAPVVDNSNEETVAEPVYEAPAAPVDYAAPVAPVDYAAPVAPVPANGKKQKKVKDPNKASGFVAFICVLFTLIGLIIYSKARKSGNEAKRVQLANALFIGIDIKLAIAVILSYFNMLG